MSVYRHDWYDLNNFLENGTYSLQAVSSSEAMGSVSVLQQPTCSVPTATVYAIPASGYVFERWNNGATQNPYTLTLTSDTVIAAQFSAMLSDTVFVYDTIEVTQLVHDTVLMHDTTVVIQTDTVFVPDYIHDTTLVYDTVWMTQYDTVFVPEYVHDTVVIHDTVGNEGTLDDLYCIILHSSNTNQGLVAGKGCFLLNTEVEIAAVPIEGNRFVSWSDGSTEQIRTIVVDDEIVLTATFEPRDMEGINDVMGAAYDVTAEQGAIVVKDAMGEGIRVFDISGRLRYQGRIETELWRLGVSTAGTYFVQIAESPAQKVVVVR